MIISPAEHQQLEPAARALLEMYQKGEHAAVLAEVDQQSKSGPLPPDVLGVAAASLLALERGDEAVKAARHAAAQSPRTAWIHHVLGRAELHRGDGQKALEAAQAACRLMPGHPDYLATLAACQRETGDLAAAVATARRALAGAPGHAGLLHELGLALAAQGDEAGALDQFRKAQAAAPKSPAAYLAEADLHRQAGRAAEARRALQRALQEIPGSLEAEERLAGTVGRSPVLHRVLIHLIHLSRLTVTGWLIVAFLYYLFFRLLEFLWKYFPALLPAGRALLLLTAVWLLGGAAAGRLLRAALRRI